jgi:hypothetical protein
MKTKRAILLSSLLAVIAMLAATTGCESESPTGPQDNPPDPSQAPVLPSPERLTFDFSFFDGGEQMAKSAAAATKLNFINAYLRVAVINVMTHLVLTPPVTAFAVALHTIPSHQPDGSWIWVYTFVDCDEEAQILLRGKRAGDMVTWQLRVTALNASPPLDNEVWFEGETRNDGDFGHWTFYDPTLTGDPAVAGLDWGTGGEGDFLALTCLSGSDAGNSLTYRHDAPDCGIEFLDAATGQMWYIRWNEAVGDGSLKVPDYNGGNPACWDEHQNDTDCAPLP